GSLGFLTSNIIPETSHNMALIQLPTNEITPTMISKIPAAFAFLPINTAPMIAIINKIIDNTSPAVTSPLSILITASPFTYVMVLSLSIIDCIMASFIDPLPNNGRKIASTITPSNWSPIPIQASTRSTVLFIMLHSLSSVYDFFQLVHFSNYIIQYTNH